MQCMTVKVEEVRLRLFVPIGRGQPRYWSSHEKLGHMEMDKTYCPRLYIEVTKYVQNCAVWQAQSRKLVSLEKTDVPNFPLEKVSMDVAGPCGETPRWNLYIISFVD